MSTQHGASIASSIKEGDANATMGIVQNALPTECNPEKLLSPAGVNWAFLEACLTKGTGISRECIACPINFMQAVAGKSLVEAPFACTMKCMPAATSSFKCGEAGEDCDPEILTKSAKCMKCVNPKIAELAHCANVPSAASVAPRLQKLLKASQDGEDALDALLKEDAADGREELLEQADKPPLAKLLALGFSIIVE